MTYKFNKLRYISPLVALAILSGCSSNSTTPTDATSTERTAYLIDSAIEGIDFTCGTLTGTTDSEGKFTYDTTKCPSGVEFKLGSLSLGTINPSAINTDTYLTIQELTGTTRDNVTDGNVTKLAVLLQSLDDDNDPTNGIYITQAIKNAITLDGNISAKTDSELSAQISARGKTEKDVNVALAHLLETTRAKDSSVAPITITPRDFNLTSVTDTELGTQTTSNTITIAGLTIPTYITISNGEYSINGGEWKSTKSLVKNDDNLTVRHTTADTVSATTTTTLKIGEMTKTFGTTTTALTPFQRSYFFQATDGTNGVELWKSDGTADGTIMVKDIVAGSYSSYPSNFTVLGDKLYFSVDNFESPEGGLWVSDGTEAGTTKVSNNIPGSNSLTVLGDTLYFSGYDSTHGTELWKSDGTADGTVMVKDIYSGGSSNLSNLIAVGNTLYFQANDSIHGRELWKSDGTADGTIMVKDIISDDGSSDPSNLIAVGNTLYFRATDGTNGYELWKSDGTADGTIMVKDIISDDGSSDPSNLIAVGNTLYFSANDGTNGYEVWKSDGTADRTMMVKDIRSDGDSSPSDFVTIGNTLYFRANDGTHGKELWKSDGTIDGTMMVKDIYSGSGSSYPTELVIRGNTLYFIANDGINGFELWKSDGTANGTMMIKDINPLGDAIPFG